MTNGLTDGRKKVGRELTKEGRTDGGRRKRHMDEGLEGEPIEGWRVLYKRKEGRRERWGRKELEKVKKYRKRKEKGMEERKGAGRRREEGEQGRKEQRKEGRKKVRLGGWIEIKWMVGWMHGEMEGGNWKRAGIK